MRIAFIQSLSVVCGLFFISGCQITEKSRELRVAYVSGTGQSVSVEVDNNLVFNGEVYAFERISELSFIQRVNVTSSSVIRVKFGEIVLNEPVRDCALPVVYVDLRHSNLQHSCGEMLLLE